MMNTTVKAKNLVEARRLLANFQELWDEAAIQQNYSNSGKLRTLAEKLHSMDALKIPSDIDYDCVENLSLESHQKLSQVRPLTVGQASRISGVNPADIAVLAIYLKNRK